MPEKTTLKKKFPTAAGILATFLGAMAIILLHTLSSCEEGSLPGNTLLIEKYGPLVEDPAGIFDLPKGFTYKVISRTGEVMNDGLLVPDKPDGMATFSGSQGRIILIRNHELMPSLEGPFGQDGALASNVPENKIYDRG
ncbi:MAG: DUF839 domain-containing protein, partial [Phaeodactylibacter sp.]|nr:DUF839 domain-containing protein [Phaeodactylibacter sp.]